MAGRWQCATSSTSSWRCGAEAAALQEGSSSSSFLVMVRGTKQPGDLVPRLWREDHDEIAPMLPWLRPLLLDSVSQDRHIRLLTRHVAREGQVMMLQDNGAGS